MVGISGKMANLALAIANAPNINTHMLRMGLALASFENVGVGMCVPAHQWHKCNCLSLASDRGQRK